MFRVMAAISKTTLSPRSELSDSQDFRGVLLQIGRVSFQTGRRAFRTSTAWLRPSRDSTLERMRERTQRSEIFEKILQEDRAARPMPSREARLTPTPASSPARRVNKLDILKTQAETAYSGRDFRAAAAGYQAALESARSLEVEAPELTRLYVRFADCLRRTGAFRQAREALQIADQLARNLPSPDLHEQKVAVDGHFAALEFAEQHFGEAEARYVAAINRCEEYCAAAPSKLARLYASLGQVYTEAGYLDTAAEITFRALELLEKAREDKPELKVRFLRHLALISYKQEDSAAALNSLKQAARLALSKRNLDDEVLAELILDLARAYEESGSDERARMWRKVAALHHRPPATA